MSNTHVMGQDRAAGFHRGFQVQEKGPRAGHPPPTKLFLAGPVMAGGQCQLHKGLSDHSLPKGKFLPSLGTGDRGVPRAVNWTLWPPQTQFSPE